MNKALGLKTLAGILALMGWVFLIYVAWLKRSELALLMQGAKIIPLSISIIFLLASNLSIALLFAELTNSNAPSGLRRDQLVGSYLLSQLGKYVPGRVWSLALQKIIVGQTLTLPNVLVANIGLAIIILCGVLGLGFSFWLAAWSTPRSMLTVLLTYCCLFGLATAVCWLGPQWEQKLGRIKTPRLSAVRSPPSPRFNANIAINLLAFMFFYSCGWYSVLAFGLGIDARQSMYLVAALSLAQVAGQLSFLPAGLGAREFSLIALGGWIGADSTLLISIAVSSRGILLILDALSAPFGFLILTLSRKESP